MIKVNQAVAALVFVAAGTAAVADEWTLDGSASKISYGSIKFNELGEVNTFGDISGSVSEDGAVTLDIGLASVNTGVDIRNERMIEHVFRNVATATVTGALDMETMNAMGVGDVGSVVFEANLSFVGVDLPIDADLTVARLSEDKVLVTTTDMILLHTADIEADTGIDKLKELASLDSITRVAPVTMTLIFNAVDPKS